MYRLVKAMATSGLTNAEKNVVSALWIWQGQYFGRVRRGMKAIAGQAGQSERTCWRGKKRLVARGFVRVVEHGGGRHRANSYEIGETIDQVLDEATEPGPDPATSTPPAGGRPRLADLVGNPELRAQVREQLTEPPAT